MLACFNINNLRTAHGSPPRYWDSASPTAKRRFVSIKRQPEGVLRLEPGFVSRAGTSPSRAPRENQDSISVVLPLPSLGGQVSLFAVFDGHGRFGQKVASFVSQCIAQEIHHLLSAYPLISLPSALRKACIAVDLRLRADSGLDLHMTGTTATICLIRDNEVTCANVGDSRIMLSGCDSCATALTHDHVPYRPDERERLELAGGRVDEWSPAGMDTGPPRVYLQDKRLPGLAVSRAFGDTILDGIISAKPDITQIYVTPDHSFLVIASDGIWSQMSMEEVTDFVMKRRKESPQKVAESLTKHATSLWQQSEDEHVDDISVILVYLQW